MVHKERCVCEICTCGKHHCAPEQKLKSTGKLKLENQGDIYVAAKTSYHFPDSLNLFHGAQDLNTIVGGDYKGHDKVGVERMKPKDQIELGQGKMNGLTVNNTEFPGYDISVTAGDVKSTAAAAAAIRESTQVEFGKEDRVKASVYGEDYQRSQQKVRKSKRRGTEVNFGADLDHTTSYKTEFMGTGGGKQKTCEFNDSLNLFSGDQDLQTIVKGDFTGHSVKGGVQKHRPKDTFEMAHLPTMESEDLPEPSVKVKAGAGVALKAAAPAAPKAAAPKAAAPKATAPKAAAPAPKRDAQVEAAANLETSRTSFNLTHAMPRIKMETDTSYKQHFPVKEGSKVEKFKFKDEIEPSTGDLDLGTIQRSDYAKFSYGRPTINRIKDNNIMGVNYGLGISAGKAPTLKEEDVDAYGLQGISVSRGSMGLVEGAAEMPVKSREGTKDSGISMGRESRASKTKIIRDKGAMSGPYSTDEGIGLDTTYGLDFKNVSTGKMRTSKKKDATISFGAAANYGTSYGDDFKLKQCLVPSLGELDEYTFKSIQSGHKVYDINCGCPPRGACGCTPPPE